MFSDELLALGKHVLAVCGEHKIMLTTAESCTGGLIAALLTEIPGSSSVFDSGFVTYSDESKSELLGISSALIKRHGAVSAQVAKAMAAGALKKSNTQLSLAVTGIAGPGGGTKAKPVGLVYIAATMAKRKPVVQEHHFKGDRRLIRLSSVKASLELLSAQLDRYS